MKHLLIASLLALSASAASAQIVGRDTAQVISVTPVTSQARQPGRCYQVPQHYQQQQAPQGNNTGMSILGGIVGGAVGSQMGQGDGKLAATALGAGIGAVWGAGQPQAQTQPQQTTQTQCEPDAVVQQIIGYDVTYVYQGRTANALLAQPPAGNTIQVTVTVDVVGNQGQQFQQQRQSQGGARF